MTNYRICGTTIFRIIRSFYFRIIFIQTVALCSIGVFAQNIPVSTQYTLLYDFLDEMAGDGYIHLNSAIRPYTRKQIANYLTRIEEKSTYFNHRQKQELAFFKNEFALELDTVPDNWVEWTNRKTFNLSLAQPSFHYLTTDKKFKMTIRPILGMDIYASKKGGIIKRWYGAEIHADIVNHISVWGSLRDVSWNGTALLSNNYYADNYAKIDGAKLTKGQYLNNLSGVQYKEANYGADFSDSRGGISVYSWWGSLSVQRENIVWGDAYYSSNILSGHNPAYPMISLNLKPCRWFEFNYFHAWLVSNVLDSTRYYIEHTSGGIAKEYRPHNKFMAANMFTFSPIPKLSFSIGNSIIYAENNVQPAYFIPFAFFKSLDHLLTKGTATQNQNSQAFFTINTRNLRHTNFYATLFVDEFSFSRLRKSNPEHNLISYQVGFSVSNWPVKDLSLRAEFTRTNIAAYIHSIDVLTYASNSYNLGNYVGDNAQNIFAQLAYRPVRGLKIDFTYTNEVKYNNYSYLRRDRSQRSGEITETISQKLFAEKTYMNNTFSLNATYEVFSNCYAVVNFSYNDARGYAPTSEPIASEDRGGVDNLGNRIILEGEALQNYYLNKFCPVYLQGKNFTFMAGLSFSF